MPGENVPHLDEARYGSGILARSPASFSSLAHALVEFAEARVSLLVIRGGDGTVRDVVTCADAIFGGAMPPIAVLPFGKTNALAHDLGIPTDWTVGDAEFAASQDRFTTRAPIEILRSRSIAPDLRGFLFGAGAFVRATALAQCTHRAGAFRGLAVGLSLAWALAQTAFGGDAASWRAGKRMRVRTAQGLDFERDFYLLFASTLERLPLGVKPFADAEHGLNILAVDAHPRRFAVAAPALLAGAKPGWLERCGYHRRHPDSFSLTMDEGFILDGELYAGGEFTVRSGQPLRFVVP